jgi:hypothetical protein
MGNATLAKEEKKYLGATLPGANPTIAVKIYNPKSSLLRFENKLFCREKSSFLHTYVLHRWR